MSQDKLPLGFRLAAARAGLRYQSRPDLALIVSDPAAVCAAFFTTNVFKAAPVLVARENFEASPVIRAVLVNSGQANACTGPKGIDDCRATLNQLAWELGISPSQILPASTGVIGQPLPLKRFSAHIPELVKNLGRTSVLEAARAIMTTDTFPKTSGAEVHLSTGTATFWGMAKGSGMICPDMATMLCFVLTDLQIQADVFQSLARQVVSTTFNALTVDGDTSTNDCLFALANGVSRAWISSAEDQALVTVALEEVCSHLSQQLIQDAEGGTKVLHIHVRGAQAQEQARMAASAVANSFLVKTAMYGQDPNWGRIVAALGRSGAEFEPDQVSVSLAGITIFEAGQPKDMDLDQVFKPLLQEQDISIEIDLGAGCACFSMLASDLTEQYVRINSHYRT